MICQCLPEHHNQIIRKGNPCFNNYQKLILYISVLLACFWLATSTLNAKIVFRSKRLGGGEIYTMNSDGTNPIRVTHDPTSALSPSWSPNGRQIVYHSTRGSQVVRDSNIWVIDADGENLRQLTHHPEWDNYPDWSPDGNQIVFDSDRLSKEGEPPRTEIFLMDTNGENVRQVTDLGFASKPRWSPDGEWILFEGDIDQGRGIYAIRPDGKDLWMVSTPDPLHAMFLGGWSPNGKQVVYAASVGAQTAETTVMIATLEKIGRLKVKKWEEVPIPKMPVQTVSFGADGKSILFGGRVWGRWQIFRFRLDTHELIQLTDEFQSDLGPREWDSRLPVSPQRLVPKRWGEIKSNTHYHQGIGIYPIPSIP